MRKAIAGFLLLSACCSGFADESKTLQDIELNNNPFSRPLKVIQVVTAPSDSLSDRANVVMALQGTLVAGENSLADISGEIFALGDEINGQRLVEVHRRYVVLATDARKTTLWVNGEQHEG